MIGSSLAPIVIAITVSAGLAAWLVMLYYAASHPLWKHQGPAREQPMTGQPEPNARHLSAAQQAGGPPQPASSPSVPGTDHPGRPQVPHAA